MASFDKTATIQKEFQSAMLTKMAESTGSQLLDLGEVRTITDAKSTTFNRAGGGTATTVAPSLYGTVANKSTGGNVETIELSPGYAYAWDQVKADKILTTSVDYNGWVPANLTRQLNLFEDALVIKALFDAKGSMEAAGASGTKLASQMETLIGVAKVSAINAGITPDKRQFVKMVMNKNTYKKLFTTSYAINNDYVQLSGMGGTAANGKAMFYGCEVTVMKQADSNLKDGEVYFIPSMTLAFGRIAGADESSAEYSLANGDNWNFAAKRSFGAAVLEADSIVYFQSTL